MSIIKRLIQLIKLILLTIYNIKYIFRCVPTVMKMCFGLETSYLSNVFKNKFDI